MKTKDKRRVFLIVTLAMAFLMVIPVLREGREDHNIHLGGTRGRHRLHPL